jgi:circadian clock protein KaiC
VKSGVAELDALLGGGIELGSSTLVLGPSGAGKSILCLQFVAAAVGKGGKAAMFVFDEEIGLLLERARPLGFDLEAMQRDGRLKIFQVDAAELSPGEFAHEVRKVANDPEMKTVLIDSLNGYQAAMPEENSLILHMHELLQYLNRSGVSTFLTVAQHGLVGEMRSPIDVTYLADTVILLRYFEAEGSVKRALSVFKKRTGRHEDTIREFWIDKGIHVGEPLTKFHGVLRGTPILHGDRKPTRSTPTE